jgi:predicted acyltransferase
MKPTQRYLALDVLRGMTIATMITVNTPGTWAHIFSPLEHSKWHGCTPTDLVFPFFLFVVGVSMFFSFSKYNNSLNKESLLKIGKRTLLIFAIGLFLNSFPQWMTDYSKLRIVGVLQRIALAYGIGSLIVLATQRKYLPFVGATILLLYWGILYFMGGTDPYSLAGNAAIPFDKAILGESHLYKGFGIPFDPEGLLSTLPAIGTVIIGYYVGELLGTRSPSGKTTLLLILFGAASFGLGYLWNLILPINKPLWTGSYVLYTAGLAMGVLAFIYLIADVWKFQIWGVFFLIFGTNALFSYFLSGIWTRLMLFIKIPAGATKITLYAWFYEKVCVPIAGNLNGSLMFAIIQMLLIWGIAMVLYRKKIMIRL